MVRLRSRNTSNTVTKLDPIIHLWLLRILVPLGGHREFARAHGFNDDTLAELLCLPGGQSKSPIDGHFKIPQ